MATTSAKRTPESLYSLVLDYEMVDVSKNAKFFSETWSLTLWISLLYVALVFGGKRFMENRRPMNLRLPLGLWSSALAIFSIVGTIRTLPEGVASLTEHSFEYSLCNPSYIKVAPTALWTLLFPYSKFIELGDTAFIVLRKKPLIFLHWYHHITVLVYTSYSYGQEIASGRYFMVLNYSAHSFMYTYYALRAFNFRIPRWISMTITLVQLSQMAVGIFINVMTYRYLNMGYPCANNYQNIFWAFLMYASYLVLFVQFFHNAYLAPKKTTPPTSTAVYMNGNMNKID